MPLNNAALGDGPSRAAGTSAGADTSAADHAATAGVLQPVTGQLPLQPSQPGSTVSIAMLPPDNLALISQLLDDRSRRNLAQADRYHRALLAPHRRLDGLTASMRWCVPRQLVQRLKEADAEPIEFRTVLLRTAMKRLQGIGARDREAVALALVHHISGLPLVMREGLLLELAEALKDGNKLAPAVNRALLDAAHAVSPTLRARLLAARSGPPPAHIGPDWNHAIAEAVELARQLPDAEALPFLCNKLRSFTHPRGLSGEDAEAMLDIAVSVSARDSSLSTPVQQLLVALLPALRQQEGADADELRARVWDALFRTASAENSCPVQRIESLQMLAITAVRAPSMAPAFAAPRAEQIRQLLAAQPELVQTHIATSAYDVGTRGPVEEPYACAQRCLGLARALDPASQSAMYASYAATMFVPPRQPGREAQWMALYNMGLEQIAALDPQLRLEPLVAWARQLDNVSDPAAFEMLASHAAAFPDAERARILSACQSRGRHVSDFDAFLAQIGSMDPGVRGPLLRQLALFLSRQPPEAQQQRFPLLLKAVTQMPAEARATLLPGLLRIASFCWAGALPLVLPVIADTIAALPMSSHASMLADVPNRNMRSAVMVWLLSQLPALEARQNQNAVAGQAPLPYRAEILRRVLFTLNGEGQGPSANALRIFNQYWPELRAALEAADPQGRDGLVNELRATLPLLKGDVAVEVADVMDRLSRPVSG